MREIISVSINYVITVMAMLWICHRCKILLKQLPY